jgi:hypothetical protein
MATRGFAILRGGPGVPRPGRPRIMRARMVPFWS